MAPAFSKEAILVGSVDHLCLVCETYLRTEQEVLLHVGTAEHSRNLDSTHYVDQYREERVRKVKKWYFCEFCNILLSTITKVRLHIEESSHIENAKTMERVGDVIFYGDIAIQEEAWHGFIDNNTCIVCNVEFEDKDDHTSESTHIINLIQCKVRNDFNNIYRKVDDSTFHCLTCNKVVAEITAHFDDMNHKKQRCIDVNLDAKEVEKENLAGNGLSQSIKKKDYANDKMNHTNESPNRNELSNGSGKKIYDEDKADIKKSDKNGANDNSDLLDSIPKFQKESIYINFKSCTAVCSRCSVDLELDTKVIENHIEEHRNTIQTKPSGTPILIEKEQKSKTRDSGTLLTSPVFQPHEFKDTENVETKLKETIKNDSDNIGNIIQKLAEEHNLTYISGGNKVYCQTCYKNVPSSVQNVNEHVNGDLHKNNIKLRSKPTDSKDNAPTRKMNAKKCNLQKLPSSDFIRKITTVQNMFSEDVVLNEKYCINIYAFAFLTVISPGRVRCQVCEVNVLQPKVKSHINLKKHNKAQNEVPVIIHTDTEFIREIRSGLFQCGFCNTTDSWEGMEEHLKSTAHKESKIFAKWHLTQCLPHIEQHDVDRQIYDDFLMRLLFV